MELRKCCPVCGSNSYVIVKEHQHSDLWCCLNCNHFGYHPKAFREIKEKEAV